MPTLDDVYRKFGEVSEAAQLLETELGSKLMFHAFVEKGISPTSLQVVDQKAAADLLSGINRQTLGQLIKNPPQQNLWVDSGSGRRPNV